MGALPGLSRRASAEIQRADRIGICSISCLELAGLARRGRVELEDSADSWIRRALAVDRVEAVALDADIAVAAGSLDRGFPGDPADRIIYATAEALDVPLITKDGRLRSYDRQRAVW